MSENLMVNSLILSNDSLQWFTTYIDLYTERKEPSMLKILQLLHLMWLKVKFCLKITSISNCTKFLSLLINNTLCRPRSSKGVGVSVIKNI